jgi:hypothetical protein
MTRPSPCLPRASPPATSRTPPRNSTASRSRLRSSPRSPRIATARSAPGVHAGGTPAGLSPPSAVSSGLSAASPARSARPPGTWRGGARGRGTRIWVVRRYLLPSPGARCGFLCKLLCKSLTPPLRPRGREKLRSFPDPWHTPRRSSAAAPRSPSDRPFRRQAQRGGPRAPLRVAAKRGGELDTAFPDYGRERRLFLQNTLTVPPWVATINLFTIP